MIRVYLILLFLFVFKSVALAQEISTINRYSLYQELVSKAAAHGLKEQFYFNQKFNAEYESIKNNPVELNNFLGKKILTLATELNRGRVNSSELTSQVHMTLKTFPYSKSVEQFLAGKLTAEQLVTTVTPKSMVYLKNLNVYQKLISLKDQARWVYPPKITYSTLQEGRADDVLVPYLRQKLNNFGYVIEPYSSQYDLELKNLVKQYQADHHIEIDGVVGPIAWSFLNRDLEQLLVQALINLDRARWLPDQLPSEYIYVNLADNHFYFKQGTYSIDFKTINGRTDRQTPVMIDVAKNVVLNPTWTVPYSIFVKDKLPLIKQDPNVVQRMHMNLIDDLTGKAVDPLTVDWALVTPENLHYTLVQKPGPWNALGFIKFPLTNKYAIYLHDTESRHLFQKDARFLSSGCVRLEKPFELAEKLLESPIWTFDKLKAFTELSPTYAQEQTWLKTKRPVPVYLFYSTVEQSLDGKIKLLNDTYQIDQNIYRLLMNK